MRQCFRPYICHVFIPLILDSSILAKSGCIRNHIPGQSSIATTATKPLRMSLDKELLRAHEACNEANEPTLCKEPTSSPKMDFTTSLTGVPRREIPPPSVKCSSVSLIVKCFNQSRTQFTRLVTSRYFDHEWEIYWLERTLPHPITTNHRDIMPRISGGHALS